MIPLLSVEDVALARLIARDRALPHGWQQELAKARNVSPSAIGMAVGGRTFAWLATPAPVPSCLDGGARCAPGHTTTRWRCPRCRRTKARGAGCSHAGHRIDHRSTRYAGGAR